MLAFSMPLKKGIGCTYLEKKGTRSLNFACGQDQIMQLQHDLDLASEAWRIACRLKFWIMSLTSSYDKFFLEKLKVSTTVILNDYLNKSTLSKQLNKAQTDDSIKVIWQYI